MQVEPERKTDIPPHALSVKMVRQMELVCLGCACAFAFAFAFAFVFAFECVYVCACDDLLGGRSCGKMAATETRQ
jgi:hypothetical protein